MALALRAMELGSDFEWLIIEVAKKSFSSDGERGAPRSIGPLKEDKKSK